MDPYLLYLDIPVGVTRGASTTGTHADSQAGAQSLKIKKNTNRYSTLIVLRLGLVHTNSLFRPPRSDHSLFNEC